MTGSPPPADGEPFPSPADGEALPPRADLEPLPPPAEPVPAPRPNLGLFRFTIEGRETPGLFVAGWLLTLVGGAAAIVGFLSGRTAPGAVLFIGGCAGLLLGLILLGGAQALERRRAGLAYAGPSPILIFGAWLAASYLIFVAVATPIELVGMELSGPAVALLGTSLQGIAAYLVLRILVVNPGALSWREMGVIRDAPQVVRELLRGAVFAIPVVFITGLVVAALVNLIGRTPDSPLPPAGTTDGLILNLLAGALVAPLSEELLFRGFATTAWARMVGAGGAILRTTVIFALAHALGQSGDTFADGLAIAAVAAGARLPVAWVAGRLFMERRSLWTAVGLHATFNGILIVIAESALRG